MLAYISGALLNTPDLSRARVLYERLAAACIAAGWEAYVPHKHADPIRDAHLAPLDVARRDLDRVRAADALVAYVGEPSLGVGAEVAIALNDGKRVLLVAEADRKVSRFLLGLGEIHGPQCQVFRYVNVEDAEAFVSRALSEAVSPLPPA
jgi:nucleoside 2-deoxyribosyltransferase